MKEMMSFPEIVITGCQGNGKSSLLSSITGLSNLVGDVTTTKAALVFQLREVAPGEREHAQIGWGELKKGESVAPQERIDNLARLKDEIKRYQDDRVSISGNAIIEIPLYIKICQ